MIPIYKAGNKSEMSNFSPIGISLLDVIYKVLEKCVKIKLSSYLINAWETSNWISVRFISAKNTSEALFDMMFAGSEPGKNSHVLLMFMDILKAFNTFDRHKKLKLSEWKTAHWIGLKATWLK